MKTFQNNAISMLNAINKIRNSIDCKLFWKQNTVIFFHFVGGDEQVWQYDSVKIIYAINMRTPTGSEPNGMFKLKNVVWLLH